MIMERINTVEKNALIRLVDAFVFCRLNGWPKLAGQCERLDGYCDAMIFTDLAVQEFRRRIS
jgi:hypothetical protein